MELEVLQRRLEGWLSARLGAPAAVEDLTTPEGTGFSSATYRYRVRWATPDGEQVAAQVLRSRPDGETVFPSYDLGTQFLVMRLLDGMVPVPPVVWYEPDPRVLGHPFLVMAQVEGRIPPDMPPYSLGGWLLEAPADTQRRLWDTTVEVLADLHRVDWRRLGLGIVVGDRTPGFAAELDRWREMLAWGRAGRPQPTLDAVADWLDRHRPDHEPDPVLLWGDARISNAIYGPDDRPVALLDWEMVTLGPPEVDLAWFLYMDHQLSEGAGASRLPGLPADDETVARYEERLGRRVTDLAYYEVFAGFRFAITMMRIGIRLIAQGLLPEDTDADRNNLATRYLAARLDLPSPGEPGPLG